MAQKSSKTKAPTVEKPVEDITYLASSLESNLEAHGFLVRVMEVNFHKDYLEFQFEFARGIAISSFEALTKDIALFLASPTGKVEIVAPIPGTHRIGIHLPRRDKDNVQVLPKKIEVSEEVEEKVEVSGNWLTTLRNFIANVLYLIIEILDLIASKIYTSERK